MKVVTMYETADGSTFPGQAEAAEHENRLNRRDALLTWVDCLDPDDRIISGYCLYVDDLACWVDTHADELKEIL